MTREGRRTDWDAVRLRDLDPMGWVFIVTAAGSFVLGGTEAWGIVAGGGSLTATLLFWFFGAGCLWVADHIARPEVRGTCNHCEDDLLVNSGGASWDAAVAVQFAEPPERVTLGPLSVVTGRQYRTKHYCSAMCAHADLGPIQEDDMPGIEELETSETTIPVQEVAE